jgi:hypothetical protein
VTARVGVTLLELVVGLTIIAAVVSVGYGSVAAVAEHRQRIAVARDEVARVAWVRRALVSWVASARLGIEDGSPAFSGLDGVHHDLPNDELTFVTTARTPLGIGETVVRLYVDRDAKTTVRGLSAELVEWGKRRRTAIQLAPDVSGLDVTYLTGTLGQPRWLPSWISSSVLPIGARITLSATPPDSLPPLLRFPVSVALMGGR